MESILVMYVWFGFVWSRYPQQEANMRHPQMMDGMQGQMGMQQQPPPQQRVTFFCEDYLMFFAESLP